MKIHKLDIKGEGTVDELIASLQVTLDIIKHLKRVADNLNENNISATLSDAVLVTKLV